MPTCPKCKGEVSTLIRRMQNVNRYRCSKCKHDYFYGATSNVPEGKGYYIWNHQNKGDVFESALRSTGLLPCDIFCARYILADVDIPGRVERIRSRLESGLSKLFVYPHAARPFIGWDGLFPPCHRTSAAFVFAEGHKEVIQAYGYDKPLHTVGWSYSKIKAFKPTELKKILFAPIHPNNNGFLSRLDRSINARVFKILLSMIDSEGIELTVRHLKTLSENGLHPDPRVEFINAAPTVTQNWRQFIQPFDLIVSHQTFAYISVAIGKPTIMMAEDEAPRNGSSDTSLKRVASWDKYKHLMMYPLDI